MIECSALYSLIRLSLCFFVCISLSLCLSVILHVSYSFLPTALCLSVLMYLFVSVFLYICTCLSHCVSVSLCLFFPADAFVRIIRLIDFCETASRRKRTKEQT